MTSLHSSPATAVWRVAFPMELLKLGPLIAGCAGGSTDPNLSGCRFVGVCGKLFDTQGSFVGVGVKIFSLDAHFSDEWATKVVTLVRGLGMLDKLNWLSLDSQSSGPKDSSMFRLY